MQGGGFYYLLNRWPSWPSGASVLPLPAGEPRYVPAAVHRPWLAICPGPTVGQPAHPIGHQFFLDCPPK